MSVTLPAIRIATRGSELALWQAHFVATELRNVLAADPQPRDVEILVISTEGDRRTDVPLSQIGGKGVFVKEVQAAVLDGRADIAVHSAKDLPAITPDGLVIAAVPRRADPRDVLVGTALASLPRGATVASGSPRRRAQLAALRPDLRFAELRGNIDTRLSKAAEFDAIVMAAAALDRLGRIPEAVDVIDTESMIPQVGQGALAIECRADDDALREQLGRIEHLDTRRAVDAERAFLRRLGGDCDVPAGAFAEVTESGEIVMNAMLADRVQSVGPAVGSTDGSAVGSGSSADTPATVYRARGVRSDGDALGIRLAEELLTAVGLHVDGS